MNADDRIKLARFEQKLDDMRQFEEERDKKREEILTKILDDLEERMRCQEGFKNRMYGALSVIGIVIGILSGIIIKIVSKFM
ncbi:MAG: hypothetical protein PVF58_14320 [Candidatus Methanofastidiosia archaeon]|jgi:hypothetical protein